MANLSQQQLDGLRCKMEVELARVIKEARAGMDAEAQSNYGSFIDSVPDSADEASAYALIASGDAMTGQHAEQMRDVDAALKRINTGVYGTCIECGSDIGFERLSVYPTAKRCIECQSHHEKTYASKPTPTL